MTSKMHMRIQIKSSHLPWANKEQTSKDVDLQDLFNNYWTSQVPELTVPGQFVVLGGTSALNSDREM